MRLCEHREKLLKQEPWRLEFLKAEEGVGEADANNRRRRAAKGRVKEEREERAELAPFGEDYVRLGRAKSCRDRLVR